MKSANFFPFLSQFDEEFKASFSHKFKLKDYLFIYCMISVGFDVPVNTLGGRSYYTKCDTK